MVNSLLDPRASVKLIPTSALGYSPARRLEHYECRREVIFVDSLPTTHLGKVDRGRPRSRPGH